MYRIFKDDCTIFLVDSLTNRNEPAFFYWDNQDVDFINQLILRYPERLFFYYHDLETLFVQFKSKFTSIIAAGGLVLNSSKELLVIFRNGKWDLPKGKVEDNEEIDVASMREVQEECGIDCIEIKHVLGKTYHLYDLNSKHYFKTTHWFLMETSQTQNLQPQLEEGITEVKWTTIDNLDVVFQNTFQNIKEVILEYLKGEY
ncbi:NUDIX hydrolase [Namhaeicola litoreus]|uniref:NUDIX hydrolase n=1 Tax=Namhaeicola litoreus TaxID=1052145 RepID=A0ABW3Y750_9FLAO